MGKFSLNMNLKLIIKELILFLESSFIKMANTNCTKVLNGAVLIRSEAIMRDKKEFFLIATFQVMH